MTPDTELRLVRAVERIADALAPVRADAEPICVHPLEARTDLSTMGRPCWRCDVLKGGCGFSVGMEDE